MPFFSMNSWNITKKQQRAELLVILNYLLCSHEGVLGAVTQDFSPFIGIGANVAEYRGLEVRTMLDHAVVMSFLPKQESTLRTSDFEKAGWPLSHLSSGAGILMHSFCCLLPFGNQVRTNIEFK